MSQTIEQMVAEVRAGLREKLGLRGWTLAAQLRRGRRLLPRHIRTEAIYLAQIAALADNPKLHRMIDEAKVRAAHRNVLAYLATIDLAAQRRAAALNMVASIAFGLLVTAALTILVLWWRGFV
ncbi:hypothetical protein [Yoonia sp.]|uniref:hypothetical protein n=1 Tax=Yoonia sp. TaxID=2212373 RepID=UPI002FDA6757